MSIYKRIEWFLPYHNIILSGGSLIMLLGVAVCVYYRSLEENSFVWLLCESESTRPKGALWFWSYVYYLSKYYELLDTFMQLMRGKYPPHYLLHAWHHGAVIIMSWVWIHHAASMQFIGIMFNTLVHVIMYYYYYLKTQKIEPKWKRYVTKLQIVQFATSFVCFVGTLYLNFMEQRQCKGMEILYGSICFNLTLFFGFINVSLSGRKKNN